MVVIALMVIGGIVVVTLGSFVLLRGWGMDVSRTEAELHEPDAHAESFAVPAGRDPAIVMAALHGAGFMAVEETPERLLVACPHAGDADRVRLLVDHAYRH